MEIVDVAGTLTEQHLAAATVAPTRTRGLELWVIQRLCDEVHVDQADGGSRLSLRMSARTAATAAAPPRHHRPGLASQMAGQAA